MNGSAGWWATGCDGAFPCGVPCITEAGAGQEGSCLKYSYLKRILGPNPLSDFHVTDEETDAQTPEVPDPRLPREHVLEPGFEPGLGFWNSRAHTCRCQSQADPSRNLPPTCRPRILMWNGRLSPLCSSILLLGRNFPEHCFCSDSRGEVSLVAIESPILTLLSIDKNDQPENLFSNVKFHSSHYLSLI